MRILIIMDPYLPVPPIGYGGHERLVEMFALQYTQLGHHVSLLVGPGSHVEGCTIYTYGKNEFPPSKKTARFAVVEAWKFLWNHRNSFDIIHNFGRLIYLLPVLNNPVKKIMTYGREISRRNIKLITRLPNKNITFTGCSSNLLSRGAAAGKWQVVYNAIDFEKYSLVENVSPDAPLFFLGRIEKVKGCHTAIKAAKETGNKLVIAGNISPLDSEKEYFEKKIKPHIDDDQIKYIGALNDEQKNTWLGKAKALLFPIEWEEPFGIVMIEAMACGTPVIANKMGSVPEVVANNETGFVVNSYDEMLGAINRIDTINRKECREKAKNKFDVRVIANEYLALVK